MERPTRILVAAMATFLVTAVAGWLALNIFGVMVGLMAPDDRTREAWDPRIEFVHPHCIELMAIAWLLLFGLCWKVTHGFRGKRRI